MPDGALTRDPRGLTRRARWAALAAAALRWGAACALGWAAFLGLAVALASFDRTASPVTRDDAASGYLDFDLAVLRELAGRGAPDGPAIWSRRPDWTRLPEEAPEIRRVPLREAWAAAAADKSRFRTAARGVLGTLPFLLAGLALALGAAGVAGVVREAGRKRGRAARVFGAGLLALLAGVPVLVVLAPGMYYERTASLGLGLAAVLFVAAFAGALPGAVARELFAARSSVRHLSALGNRPALASAARLGVLDASGFVGSLVPVLAVAALFVCAKADQDPALQARSSGLGSLIRSAIAEPSTLERGASAALVGGALVLLWALGHRFVLEVRRSLGGEA